MIYSLPYDRFPVNHTSLSRTSDRHNSKFQTTASSFIRTYSLSEQLAKQKLDLFYEPCFFARSPVSLSHVAHGRTWSSTLDEANTTSK